MLPSPCCPWVRGAAAAPREPLPLRAASVSLKENKKRVCVANIGNCIAAELQGRHKGNILNKKNQNKITRDSNKTVSPPGAVLRPDARRAGAAALCALPACPAPGTALPPACPRSRAQLTSYVVFACVYQRFFGRTADASFFASCEE